MKIRNLLATLALLFAANASATELIAPGTSLSDSADITSPFSLFIKPASGDVLPPGGVNFYLQKKSSTGLYNTVLILNAQNITWAGVVEAGGTYRVERQPSSNSAGMDYEIPAAGSSAVTCAACATSAKQDTMITALQSLVSSMATLLTNTTGLSTASLQSSGNTTLSTISSTLTSLLAKTPALGTAGTASADVITVQGIANGTVIPVSVQTSTTGGWPSQYSANLTNTAVAVDGSAGTLGKMTVMNNNTAVCYVQVWNTAQGSVTVGTTAPYVSYGIPANSGAQLDLNSVYTTAITVAATTTRANATACTSGLDVNIAYK